MCGFIAQFRSVQLVEYRIGITEVRGSNPVEALILSSIFFPIAQIGKFSAMIILHFLIQLQFKYELIHVYFTKVLFLYGIRGIKFISVHSFSAQVASIVWKPAHHFLI